MRAVDEIAPAPLTSDSRLEEVGCSACGSGERTEVGPLSGYRFHRCAACGLVYMSPRPVESELDRLYDESYFESDDPRVGYPVYREDAPSLRYKAERLLGAIERHRKPGRFLDVGCAYGFSLEVARARGWDVYGIEPAHRVAERVRREMGVPVATSLFGAELEAASFDAVALWDVIEHLPRLGAFLSEFARILRPGGLLSVVTPDAGSLAAKVLGARWEERRKMPEHIYFFDRPSLASLLRRSGFEPLEWGTAGKRMPVREAAERLLSAVPSTLHPILRFVASSPLGAKVVYLDPRWKLSVVARAGASR